MSPSVINCVSCTLMLPPGRKISGSNNVMFLLCFYISYLEFRNTWWEVISLHVLFQGMGSRLNKCYKFPYLYVKYYTSFAVSEFNFWGSKNWVE